MRIQIFSASRLCAGIALLVSASAFCAETLSLNCGTAIVHFSAQTGAIVEITDNEGKNIAVRSAQPGLFMLEGDVRTARAHISSKSIDPRNAECKIAKQDGKVIATYKKNGAEVRVVVSGGNGFLDFQTEVWNHNVPFVIKQVHAPGKLVLGTETLQRVIMPGNAMQGCGLAFEKAFFQLQRDVSWARRDGGTDAYERLFGGKCMSLNAHQVDATNLKVTPDGAAVFPKKLVEEINKLKRKVTRASGAGQYDEILINSPNGPFFSTSSLGGKGRIGRFGVWQVFNDFKYYEQNGKILFVEPVKYVIAQRSTKEKSRNKIVLFDLKQGPSVGVFSKIPVAKWRKELKALAEANHLKLISAESPEKMLELLQCPDVLAIVNPYGEGLPISNGGRGEMIEAIRTYVKNGGYWQETAGLSFWSELVAEKFFNYKTEYPSAAADFQHVDFTGSGMSLYSVQPLPTKTWDKNFLLHASRLQCEGSENGAVLDRDFMVWIPQKKNWKSPIVRIRFGKVEDNLSCYVTETGINKKLEDKMSPDLLKAFKESLLVRGEGYVFRYTPEVIKALPVPCLLHVEAYMRAGFDLSYPDHFPFAPGYEKFPAIQKTLAKTERYIMPYSNSSFWCETTPRPPTFAQAGMAPLLRGIDGKPNREVYGWGSTPNQGFTTCLWHPEVRKANDKIIREFQTIFPVPILFQDQVGVRLNLYDFNPAAPDPAASYCTGLIYQAMSDAAQIPITTEGGYAHLANAESAFYGMAFSLIPTPHRGSAMKDYSIWPAEQWKIFPLAQYVLHGFALMGNHNFMGYFYNMECLSWNLGLGYSLMYKPDHVFQKSKISLILEPERYSWMHYLAAMQKYVMAPSVGEPLTKFEHKRLRNNDSGIIKTSYGKQKIIANLNNETLILSEKTTLAPHGFYVTSPDLRAGYLSKCGGDDLTEEPVAFICVKEKNENIVIVYAKPGTLCTVELPEEGDFNHILLEDGRRINCENRKKYVTFKTLPSSRFPDYKGHYVLKGILQK